MTRASFLHLVPLLVKVFGIFFFEVACRSRGSFASRLFRDSRATPCIARVVIRQDRERWAHKRLRVRLGRLTMTRSQEYFLGTCEIAFPADFC
jgi:hypothetical protein